MNTLSIGSELASHQSKNKMINKNPKKFENVEVYSGQPQLAAASGVVIKNLVFGDKPTYKNLMGTIPVLGKEFEISFKFYFNSWTESCWQGSCILLWINDKYIEDLGPMSNQKLLYVYWFTKEKKIALSVANEEKEWKGKRYLETQWLNCDNCNTMKEQTWNFIKILRIKIGKHVKQIIIDTFSYNCLFSVLLEGDA